MKLLRGRTVISVCVAILLWIVAVKPVQAAVIISEVYPAPATGESEWVEVFNSGTAAVSVSGWFLKDQLTTPSVIFSFSDQIIQPQQFFVAELPSAKLNNGGDGVTIFDGSGQQVDVMSYTSSEGSKSWQRTSINSTNFTLTVPTKGSNNVDYSLLTPQATATPNPTVQPTATPVSTTTPAPSSSPTVTPTASPAPTNETLATATATPMPSASPSPSPSITPSPVPTNSPTPNPTVSPTPLPTTTPDYRSIQLSEIAPCPSSGNEWLELYNAGSTEVTIKNWKLTDESGNTKTLSGNIPATGWQVFSWSGSLLNNSGDSVTIMTDSGAQIAHAEYSSCTIGFSLTLATVNDTTAWVKTDPTPGAKNSDVIGATTDDNATDETTTTTGTTGISTTNAKTSTQKKASPAVQSTLSIAKKNPTQAGKILGTMIDSLTTPPNQKPFSFTANEPKIASQSAHFVAEPTAPKKSILAGVLGGIITIAGAVKLLYTKTDILKIFV